MFIFELWSLSKILPVSFPCELQNQFINLQNKFPGLWLGLLGIKFDFYHVKLLINQNDITFLNGYVPNKRSLKYMEKVTITPKIEKCKASGKYISTPLNNL